jgi:uncharacterized phage infection (PIP) family protein YhgE
VYDTVKNTAASKLSGTLTKQTDKIVKPLMTAVVPMEIRSDPEIKQILASKQQNIKDQQTKMIEKTASSGADAGLKFALAIPVTGNLLSLASAADSGVSAFKNLFSGFKKVKDEITDLRKKVCQVRARIAAAKNAKCGLPGLGSLTSKLNAKLGQASAKVNSMAAKAVGSAHKGGGLRNETRKMKTRGSSALDRTRRSIEYFHDPTNPKKQVHTKKYMNSPGHLKTRKLYADKILHRTGQSIRAFSG